MAVIEEEMILLTSFLPKFKDLAVLLRLDEKELLKLQALLEGGDISKGNSRTAVRFSDKEGWCVACENIPGIFRIWERCGQHKEDSEEEYVWL